MDLSGLYNTYAPLIGQLAGDSFDIWRPNYAQADNTLQLIAEGQKFRCDPTTGRFAEPRFNGVMYYDIFGRRDILQPGDILIKSTPDGMTPAITISSFMPVKTLTGVRTARIGKLIDSKDDPGYLYNPVYFDFLGPGFPGSQLNKALEESLKVPNTQVVLFSRQNVTRQRSHLVEIDSGVTVQQPDGSMRIFERTWLIDEIDYTGPLMVLTLRNK